VTKVLLVLATVVDLALAALLVGVSGFLFGGGPESMHGGFLTMVGYLAALIGCLAAPIVGFTFNRQGKAGIGLAAAWVPVAGALAALIIPAPY
jgi:hypothetical protein